MIYSSAPEAKLLRQQAKELKTFGTRALKNARDCEDLQTIVNDIKEIRQSQAKIQKLGDLFVQQQRFAGRMRN